MLMLMKPVGIVLGHGVLRIGLASTIAAACLAFISALGSSHAVGAEFDLSAFNIRAEPKPGPVTEFRPIKSLPPIPFQLPFDWGMDPFDDDTWQFRLHTLRSVDQALAAGDFDYARAVFLDWQRWHENCWWSWPLCFERAAAKSWNDMATGIRASRLAYLLRSTGWRDERLIELAERHAEKLQDPGFVADNHNHAIFQLHGLAALCLDEVLRACRGARPFIRGELQALLKGQFTAAGMHRENSPEYHFFVADHLSHLAPLLRPFAPELDAVLARAEEVKKWLVFPDQTLAQIGDSNLQLRSRWRKQLVAPRGEARCRNARSYREAPECYLTKHFEDAGYVIARSDWAVPAERASMLFLQGGFFNRTHRDADDLTFEWFERGRKILSDSGKYIVTEDEWRDYFDSTRAHNTVEVDGQDYPRSEWGAEAGAPYGTAVERVERAGGGVRIVMAIEHGSLEVAHRREIDYQPGERLSVIDTLRSDRSSPRRYVQWHNFAAAFDLTGAAGRFEANDGELSVRVAVSSSCGNQTTYELVKGQVTPRIHGWASVANRERHPRWVLGVVCQAETARFSAHFTFDDVARDASG